jgi:hypothetical protein
VKAAAKTAGVGNATPYKHRGADEQFRADWDAVLARSPGARRLYWGDGGRSGEHRRKLGKVAYRAKIERGIVPKLEQGLRSPTVSERREVRKVGARSARRHEIAAALRADPGRSNASIAQQLRRDAGLVGIIRRQLEDRGEIPIRTWGGRRLVGRAAYPHKLLRDANLAIARSEATSRAAKASPKLYRKRVDAKHRRFLELLEAGWTIESAGKEAGWKDLRYARRVARAAGHAPRAPGRPRKSH